MQPMRTYIDDHDVTDMFPKIKYERQKSGHVIQQNVHFIHECKLNTCPKMTNVPGQGKRCCAWDKPPRWQNRDHHGTKLTLIKGEQVGADIMYHGDSSTHKDEHKRADVIGAKGELDQTKRVVMCDEETRKDGGCLAADQIKGNENEIMFWQSMIGGVASAAAGAAASAIDSGVAKSKAAAAQKKADAATNKFGKSLMIKGDLGKKLSQEKQKADAIALGKKDFSKEGLAKEKASADKAKADADAVAKEAAKAKALGHTETVTGKLSSGIEAVKDTVTDDDFMEGGGQDVEICGSPQ
jgi:hypothetical protein